MAAKSFKTILEKGFVQLPFDVPQEFGKARPPVKVTINGYTSRSTVSVYGGKYFVPVRKDRQQAAKLKPGDTCRVTIASDNEVRDVEPPADPREPRWPRMPRQEPGGTS